MENLNKEKNEEIYLDDVVKSWILYKKYKIKNSTYYRYQYIINKYIISEFKDQKIIFFEGYDFNKFIDNLAQKLSTKTIKDIIIVFKSILKYAERKYNLDFKLDLISIPKNKTKNIEILLNKDKNKLQEQCLKNATYRDIGIIICLNTGIRIGEICALKWDNINLDKNILKISKTMQRVYKNKKDTVISIDTPKSQNSIREIPISQKLHNILKEIKDKNKFKGDEFFLTGVSEKYIEPRNYQYMFKKILKESNVQMCNFHVLRHTFATNCIEIGMDIKSLSEILGHSNVNITLNRYVHSSLKRKKSFLEKL